MKECGLKSFRFSISWARIFPKGNGKINQKGIDFYNDVINELIRNDIVPIVNLFHFDLPQGLIDQYKGFVSRRCIDDFINYARVCFENFFGGIEFRIGLQSMNKMLLLTFLSSMG